MRAVIVADGDVPDRGRLDEAWPGWADGVGLVIAADGGAAGVDHLGLAPDLVVGDMDSIGPDRLARLRGAGVAIDVAPADKDESDTELAVLAALARGADALTIVGRSEARDSITPWRTSACLRWRRSGIARSSCSTPPLGSRWSGAGRGRAPGSPPASGPDRAVVSLLPLGRDVTGVTTRARFALRDEALPVGPARGLSNVRESSSASIASDAASCSSSSRLLPSRHEHAQRG
jgi:thiamine pyrophosphokinase